MLEELVEARVDDFDHVVRRGAAAVLLVRQLVAVFDEKAAGVAGENRWIHVVNRLAGVVAVGAAEGPMVERPERACEEVALSAAPPVASAGRAFDLQEILRVVDSVVHRLLQHDDVPPDFLRQGLKLVVGVADQPEKFHRVGREDHILVVVEQGNVLRDEEQAVGINDERLLTLLAANYKLRHGVQDVPVPAQSRSDDENVKPAEPRLDQVQSVFTKRNFRHRMVLRANHETYTSSSGWTIRSGW